MELVIGGYGQGKLSYVLSRKKEAAVVFDAELPEITENSVLVINHLHLWVRNCLLNGREPEYELEIWLNQKPDCIFISDEIGNGIVPLDSFEREYRERTGRLLVMLAEKAECVERVICGLAQRIK